MTHEDQVVLRALIRHATAMAVGRCSGNPRLTLGTKTRTDQNDAYRRLLPGRFRLPSRACRGGGVERYPPLSTRC